MYKFFKRFFSRSFFLILAVLIQILWFTMFMLLLGSRYPVFAGIIRALTLFAVIGVVNQEVNPSFKLAWTLLMLTLPIVGFSVYLIFGRSRMSRPAARRGERARRESLSMWKEDPSVRAGLEERDPKISRQSLYLRNTAHFPVYRQTQTEYFPEGEFLYERMVEELEKAEHFIFLEYFIIDNGQMWGTILDILEKKAAQGLDVRIIYDDVGCVNTLPVHFYRKLRERGIQCEVFNPFKPIASIVLNNRDHRKIMVIDGYVGFTGGINLADEYINRKVRYGHWKDTGIMLRGEAVWNFTIMFLQMWSVVRGSFDELSAASPFRPHKYHRGMFPDDGFVQPYGDDPLDGETVGENVYLEMIAQAVRYIYIFTPYLIIDNEMQTALCLAARSGVDVRIVTPGIPDKKLIFLLSRSYYRQLVDSGVRIYEYTPGFLHAKCFVCDDVVATVGTINLDYRSLYMHFECGVWMYQSSAVAQVYDDVVRTMELSREITAGDCRRNKLPARLLQVLLRLMAPML